MGKAQRSDHTTRRTPKGAGGTQRSDHTTRRTPNVTHEVATGITLQEAGGPLVGPGSVFATCEKNRANPGHHDKFIKVTDFTVDKIPDFPGGRRVGKDLMYRWIKSNVPLVGRIHGRYISKERPDTWHSGTVGYLFADHKGQSLNTVGSGRVWSVTKGTDGKCKCKKCAGHQLQPASPYWEIHVYTARHVMFDTSEAQHSDFVLFDDDDDGSGTVTLSGGEVTWSDTEEDYCDVTYYTHDQDLAGRMQEMVDTRDEMTRQVDHITGRRLGRYTFPVFVVAHPHGRQKYVTVGEYKGRCGENNQAVTFTSATCPGCSGGAVICHGRRGWDVIGGRAHSGVDAEGKGVSADGYYI